MADEIVEATEILSEAVAERVADQLENAEARIEEARQTAQAITDAALQTALGQQVERLREENSSWRTTMESRMQTQDQILAEIRDKVTAPPVVVPLSLIPEASANQPPVERPIPEIQTPAENGADADGQEDQAEKPSPTKRRRIM